MLGKVIRFVIVSRFSKSILILLVLMGFYVILFDRVSSGASTFSLYYGPAITAFVLALPTLNGGIAVLKSDKDYLFTMPIKRVDLAISLYLVQFLSFGLMIFYLYVYMAGYLKTVFISAIVVIIATALSATSLGPATYALNFKWRFPIAIGLAAWSLSSLLGLQYSPAAIFTGHPVTSALTASVLALVTTPLAFRSLMRVDLDLMKRMSLSTSKDVKNNRNFARLSSVGAIFSEHFNIVEISGRMNTIGGGSSYRSGRFQLRNGLFVTVILGIVYFLIVQTMISKSLFHVLSVILSEYSIIIVMFVSMGVLANERLWLGFLSVGPVRYLRIAIGARVLSFLVLLSPIAVSNFILAYYGFPGALGYGLVLLCVFPSLLIMTIYLSAFLSPVQIKEDMLMPGQYNLRQMALALPLIIAMVVSSIIIGVTYVTDSPILFAEVATIGSAIVVVPSILLLASKRVGKKTIESLVRNGFV
ncbi:MAG: hypothetical protein M1526_02635 [Candidatus Thermoplasmatota archaeon]|jgi:hypothetical protein|nr:hypothetical protein [Candidatus Thermoplasmatota archaeon]